jgi:hypothetical protein
MHRGGVFVRVTVWPCGGEVVMFPLCTLLAEMKGFDLSLICSVECLYEGN